MLEIERVEAIFINPPDGGISFEDLPPRFRAHVEASGRENTSECERILAALFAVDWNKSKAAAALHWSRMTLYRKMAKYHIERDSTHAATSRQEGSSPRQSRETRS